MLLFYILNKNKMATIKFIKSTNEILVQWQGTDWKFWKSVKKSLQEVIAAIKQWQSPSLIFWIPVTMEELDEALNSYNTSKEVYGYDETSNEYDDDYKSEIVDKMESFTIPNDEEYEEETKVTKLDILIWKIKTLFKKVSIISISIWLIWLILYSLTQTKLPQEIEKDISKTEAKVETWIILTGKEDKQLKIDILTSQIDKLEKENNQELKFQEWERQKKLELSENYQEKIQNLKKEYENKLKTLENEYNYEIEKINTWINSSKDRVKQYDQTIIDLKNKRVSASQVKINQLIFDLDK